ncbi:putative N-acetylated-alpha-linked acidic dipeptidase [Ptychodera flava]|uniref:putative N-acetylated-alpha-linked acidic dipeptidase n=1 Tax=Ptychodera flava TaxID=63121 RepID=UPI003969BF17
METAKDVNRARKVASNWRLILAILILIVVVLFVVGIVIGYFVGLSKEDDVIKATLSDADESVSRKLMEAVNAENIRKNLEYLTSKPHLAGTPADKEQADYIVKLWLEQGLDHAQAVPYNVLLSYPSKEQGNKVEILNKYTSETVFTSKAQEDILDDSQNDPDVVPPFNAYSAAGEVDGEVVYANYARVEDFFHLQRDLNIDLNGTVIIARYGMIFRGDKVANAKDFGAVGIILYSDPEDVAPAGEETYPNGIFLPETGVQRGSTFKHAMDPLTPGYPATGYAYRMEESETELPTIPVHPIGYSDAKEILRRMKGNEVQKEWKGEIPGVTYRYGPGLAAPDDDKTVKVSVYSSNTMVTTYNTIGMIRGSVEPDRYVLLGNHRDAWIFGAIDPSSGTASIMEVTRVFGQMVKDGWRPRRTLVFCTWGAEEYGLIGSNEWVEENMKSFIPRGVAYINVDAPLQGIHYLKSSATPNLKRLIYNAARKIPDPSPSGSRKTIYDTMVSRAPMEDDVPKVYDLGSASDYASFLHRMGMSAIDMSYRWDTDKYNFSIYPIYHSVYETFHLVETFYDPQFKYLQGMARMWIEVAWQLADSLILPFNCEDYGIRVKKMFDGFSGTDSAQKMRDRGLSLDNFEDAVNTFKTTTAEFQTSLGEINRKSPMEIRRVNDQLMSLDRAFVDPLGLPGRKFIRHVIFAPSSKDVYATAGFPGLIDALFDIDNSPNPTKQWREVERELAVITYHLYSAANTMGDLVTSLTRSEL